MYYRAHQLALRQCVRVCGLVSPLPSARCLDTLSAQQAVAAFSVRQGIELLGAALQSVPVLQIGVVAFRDPLGAVEETPAAAGNHRCAVAVAWAVRKGNGDISPVKKQCFC